MPIEDDIAALVVQESALILPAFTPDTAWQIGTTLRDLALRVNLPLVINVRRFGSPHQQLFYCALAGTTPDNQRWVERKVNPSLVFTRVPTTSAGCWNSPASASPPATTCLRKTTPPMAAVFR